MIKLSSEQAYEIGVKLALESLGVVYKAAQAPIAGAVGPASAAMARPPQPPPRPVPAGAQPIQGAAPGSVQNPNWRQQAMPSLPPMRPTLRMPS